MKKYNLKRIVAASLSAMMLVTAVPGIAYAEEPDQNVEQSQENQAESEDAATGSEEITVESEEAVTESEEAVTGSEEVTLSQQFEVQPGNEDAKNEEGKACFVSGVDPDSIKLTESSGSGWNITALGELSPEQFVLEGAFSNMVVTGVSVEPREDDAQVSDTIVLDTEEAVNAGGVNDQNEYVMDKYPTGKITVAAGVFGQDAPIEVETPVETPNITLKDLKADGESVETVPADAKSITGTLAIDGKLENYAYFFSPDSQEEDGKRENEVAVLNAGEGLSSSTISAGEISGDYHNELGFEVEVKDISSETGTITVPQEENTFDTALTVSIPLETKKAEVKDTTDAEVSEDTKKDTSETDGDQVQEESKSEEADQTVDAEAKTEEESGENKQTTETKKVEETKESVNKGSVENINKQLASLKDSIPGKLVAQTKSFLASVQTAVESTQEAQLKLDTGRTTYYGGESVTKLSLKLSGPVSFKKDKIAKLTKKNYGDYFILGDGFSDLKITNIKVSSSNDKEITLTVSGNVKSENGYYKDATVKVNTPVLSGYDDLLAAEVAVEDLKVSLTDLKADGVDAESINCDTTNISGTIEVEKVDGIDTYFKETSAFTSQPIALELDGAFRGAKSSVKIDSNNKNKLNFQIKVSKRPMTEDYGTIKIPGGFAFTNSEIKVPDIKINRLELSHSKAVGVEKTENGLEYTIDVDVTGGTFKDKLTQKDLNFTAPFSNQTKAMRIQMKKNDDGEMNGFVVTLTLNPNSMGKHATGTMTLAVDKVYYPDGESTYGLPLSLEIQDNYVKPKEEESSEGGIDTDAVIEDVLQNLFEEFGDLAISALDIANPFVEKIVNVGVGALNSFLSGDYDAKTESDRDVLMKEIQESLDTTTAHIDSATQETKDYMSFKLAQEAQDKVNDMSEQMKDTYSTDINFVKATKTIMEMDGGALTADDAEYVDEVLQNIYSSDAQTNKKGVVSQTYKDNLIQLGRKLLDTQKDDNGNARNAFDNYEYICQNVYGMNIDGFDNRKLTNDNLITMYEYGYKIMVTAVCYDIQKHKTLSEELDQKIAEKDKNEKTYVNLQKNVKSAIIVSENVLKQLEAQNTAIQNAYSESKGRLDKEVAAYDSENRIAKCYWINKDLSLNASIIDVNEDLKGIDDEKGTYGDKPLYVNLWEASREHVAYVPSDIYGKNYLFDYFFVDKSGFINKWELNDAHAKEDGQNSSSPFYNSITEDEAQQIQKKLEQKKDKDTVMGWFDRYLYIDGKPITETMENQTEYSIPGIYLAGWQEKKDIKWYADIDDVEVSRYVKYMDENENIEEKRVLDLRFGLYHTGKMLFWGGRPQAVIISVNYNDGEEDMSTEELNELKPLGVICIKKAY